MKIWRVAIFTALDKSSDTDVCDIDTSIEFLSLRNIIKHNIEIHIVITQCLMFI